MTPAPRIRCWFLGCAAGLLALTPARAQDAVEYAVKAAYMTKFVPFIEWPDSAFASSTAPVTICILGDDPFGTGIDKAASGAATPGRSLVVRRIAVTDTSQTGMLANCQMAFVSDPLVGLDVLDALRDKPVVTVTDGGMRARGTISFVKQDNHVRFDIDDAAAEKNGIHISSKLLSLAHAVTRREGGP